MMDTGRPFSHPSHLLVLWETIHRQIGIGRHKNGATCLPPYCFGTIYECLLSEGVEGMHFIQLRAGARCNGKMRLWVRDAVEGSGWLWSRQGQTTRESMQLDISKRMDGAAEGRVFRWYGGRDVPSKPPGGALHREEILHCIRLAKVKIVARAIGLDTPLARGQGIPARL